MKFFLTHVLILIFISTWTTDSWNWFGSILSCYRLKICTNSRPWLRGSCSRHNSLRPGSGSGSRSGCRPWCGPGCGTWRSLYWPGSSSNRSLRPADRLSPRRLLIDSSRLRLWDSILTLLRLLLLT